MKKLVLNVAILAITSQTLFGEIKSPGGPSSSTTYMSGAQKAYGGTGNDGGDVSSLFYSDLKLISGGYILGGMSNSAAGAVKSVSTYGSHDYYVVKTDYAGTIIWDKTYGGTGSDKLGQIFPTSDGGYLLAGSSASGISGNKTTAAFGSGDAWFVKINALGTILWQKSYGGTGGENTTKNIFEVNGRYYVGVASNSGATGNKTIASYGGVDYVIVGLNTQTGAIEFEKAYGGSGDDDLHSIHVNSNGSFVLFGHSQSDADGIKTTDNMGDWDYWALSCSANGTILWQRSFGGDNYDFVTDARAIKRSDGSTFFIMGGISNSPISVTGKKSEDTHGGQDIWLVAMDVNGTKLWDHTYGGTEDDILQAIDLQSNIPMYLSQTIYDQAIILTGYSNSDAYTSINGYKTDNNFGPSDGWVVIATAATGKQTKDFVVGGTGDDAAMTTKALLIDPTKGDYDYVTLSFSASGISGNKSVASLGGYDMWLHVMQKRTIFLPLGAKESATGVETGINESTIGSEISNSIYPTVLKNGDELSVLSDMPEVTENGGTLQATIFNLEGKVIFKETVLYGIKKNLRPAFPSGGIYIISITNTDNKPLCNKRIIVEQ